MVAPIKFSADQPLKSKVSISDPGDQNASTNAAKGVAKVVERNIQDLIKVKARVEKKKTKSEQVASWVVKVAGNMWFAYAHVVWFIIWIGDSVLNGKDAFDPFPFSMLTTVVSLEAIFLTLFVLVSQNLQAKHDEQRANLHLQIDLLAEHEITKLLCLVDAIADKLGVEQTECSRDVSDLEKEVTPAQLLKELNRQEKRAEARR